MTAMEWTLEIVLMLLLGATLFQAIRLERALGVLKRDRAALEAIVAGFNVSTSQAESGIQRLHAAADGAGRQIAGQLTKSVALRDDMAYLTERGERLADRLDNLIRTARPMSLDAAAPASVNPASLNPSPAAASQAERDLMQALRLAR